MQKILFRFVKQAVSIARKLTDAALIQISDPAGNGVAGWKHAVLHFLREHMDATLAEVLVGGETVQVARVPQGDLRANVRSVGPLRATVNVDNRALRGIDEKRRLYGLYIPVTPLEIVARCFSAVEVGDIDGSMTGLIGSSDEIGAALAKQPSALDQGTYTAQMDQ